MPSGWRRRDDYDPLGRVIYYLPTPVLLLSLSDTKVLLLPALLDRNVNSYPHALAPHPGDQLFVSARAFNMRTSRSATGL